MVTAKREPAQEETQTQQNPPRGVFWIVLGFFLGRLPFGRDHFLTTFFSISAQNHYFTIFGIWAVWGTWRL